MTSAGIVVLGMHRSGTSSVTRVLNLLGASLGADDDLMHAADNPRGHWESTELVDANDRVLAAHGGSWRSPPPLATGWERGGAAETLLPDLAETFARVYADAPSPWVWKDPRTCLTLPLWRRVLDSPVVVLVLRDPRPVATSLRRRNGFRIGYGMNLWERYTRAAVAAGAGLPVVVVRFEQMHDDPAAGVARLCDGLAAVGLPLDGDRAAAAASIHVARGGAAEESQLSARRTALLRTLDALPESSRSFEPPGLPDAPFLVRRFGTTRLARPYGWSARFADRPSGL